MLRTLSLCALVALAPAFVHAQTVAIALTPKQQAQTGGETRFVITPTISTGFTGSLFLKATCATLPGAEFRFSPSAINQPYQPTAMFVSVKGAREAGDHQIIVEAYNGPLSVVDTCTLTIRPRPAWKVYDRSNSRLPSDTVAGIAVAPSGTAWIGTEKGLVRLDGTTWTAFSELDTFGDHFYPSVSRIAIDSLGTVWAMRHNVLLVYRDGSWERVTPPLGGGDHLAAATDGGLWLVGERFMTYRAPDGVWSFMKGEEVPFTGVVSSIDIGHTGALWIASANGVHRFDWKYWTSYRPEDLINSTYLENPIIAVGGDTAWVRLHQGVIHIDADGISTPYPESTAPSSYPKRLRSDGAGTLWRTHPLGGLVRSDGTNQWHYTTGNSGLPSDWIHTLHLAPDGKLWIGTDRGVAVLDVTFPPNLAFDLDPTSVSFEQVATEPAATVAPHPVRDGAMVHLDVPTPGLVTVRIHSLDGTVLQTTTTAVVEAGQQVVPLDLSSLPASTYLVQVSVGSWTTTRTIVVQR